MKPPLILTLLIDENSLSIFNKLRQQHFPPSRNFIDAHLTLFHALPNEELVVEAVKETAASHKSFVLSVTEPVSIGNGVAFKLESSELLEMHKAFQNRWQQFLRLQDRQKIRPHITVQNKVTAAEARQLLQELKSSFIPFTTTAKGLQLWEYLNGPWKLLNEFTFFNNPAS